jgi:ribosome-binding protein aMBF1 (putative translation factor)
MNKNREARREALQRVIARRDDVIIPKKLTFIPEDAPPLETILQAALLEKTVGGLLEDARKERKVSKRELARKLNTVHARVSQMEKASNLELRSILEVARSLGYDVEITLIPQQGGRSLGTVMKTASP